MKGVGGGGGAGGRAGDAGKNPWPTLQAFLSKARTTASSVEEKAEDVKDPGDVARKDAESRQAKQNPFRVVKRSRSPEPDPHGDTAHGQGGSQDKSQSASQKSTSFAKHELKGLTSADFNFTLTPDDDAIPAATPQAVPAKAPLVEQAPPVITEPKEAVAPEDPLDLFELDDSLLSDDIPPEEPTRRLIAGTSALRYERFLVLQVQYGEGTGQFREKVLRLFQEASQRESIVYLRGDWYNVPVQVGDSVHVVGVFSQGRCVIDNANNLLIHHPDTLVTSKLLSESFSCLRRTVVNERFRFQTTMPALVVLGSIFHDLVEVALAHGDFSEEFLNRNIEEMLVRHIEGLALADKHEEDARIHLREHLPAIRNWAGAFLGDVPNAALQVDRNVADAAIHTTACATRIVDIEENVWSPAFGIKGKIDATVEIKIHRKRVGAAPIPDEVVLAPLEFKSGRAEQTSAHRAQVILYCLLMSERYGTDIENGLLCYLKSGATHLVPLLWPELRAIVMQRNRVAASLTPRTPLPDMLRSPQQCERCSVADACMLLHRALENGTAQSSGAATLFDSRAGHLTQTQMDFINHWIQLIDLEQGDMTRLRKEIWCMSAPDREAMGTCIGSLVACETPSLTPSAGNHHVIAFKRVAQSQQPVSKRGSAAQMVVGDPIVVSSEHGHFALAVGFVRELGVETVSVTVDRPLRSSYPRLNADGSPSSGVMDIGSMTFRVDRDELTSGMSTVRSNVLSLFIANGEPSHRRLVVDLEAPRFVRAPLAASVDVSSLNQDQKRAIERVINAEDYAIILGMPGTGKTTTLACIVRALVAQGKSVLLAAYTHSAVDNIVRKLIGTKDISLLRLGNPDKLHPEVLPYSMHGLKPKTVADVLHIFDSPSVVATTCLGVTHALIRRRRFDYCVIDEASQVTLPVCLGPILHADRFVLVGDHYQLPPLVRNTEARRSGFDVSLFRRLCEAHPSAVVSLSHQYRMNADIMWVANELIYGHRLRCSSLAVEQATLALPTADRLRGAPLHPSDAADGVCGRDGEACWTARVMAPERAVVFVDTDSLPAEETKKGDLVRNDVEVELVAQLIGAAIMAGVPQSDIGVISPYRAQLRAILDAIKQIWPDVEVNTIDRYQGRQKAFIIVSFVRANPRQAVGELLRDWRRINVALTRAEKKMVLIGSASTLSAALLFRALIERCAQRGWIVQPPPRAHELHRSLVPLPSQGTQEFSLLDVDLDAILSDSPIAQEVAGADL